MVVDVVDGTVGAAELEMTVAEGEGRRAQTGVGKQEGGGARGACTPGGDKPRRDTPQARDPWTREGEEAGGLRASQW